MKIDVKGLILPKSMRKEGEIGDDRIAVLRGKSVGVALLADGATGWGYGGVASSALLKFIMDEIKKADPMNEDACVDLLEAADTVVNKATGGEGDTTAILLVTDGSKIWGASAGDSICTRYGRKGENEELTWCQMKRPRLGNGCQPVGFSAKPASGDTFIMASDGLWNFVYKAEKVAEAAANAGSAEALNSSLVALVRENNSGKLPDDLAMITIKFE